MRDDDLVTPEDYEKDIHLRISTLRTKWYKTSTEWNKNYRDQVMQYLFSTIECQQREIEGLRLYIATGTDPKEAE